MSAHVVTEFKTKPERAEELVQILSQALPDSLAHDGCEAIALRRNQDDPANIVSFTQWATRRHYDDYLAWRTEAGLTDEVSEMLSEPMSIKYFDEVITISR
jgi:quinol monooxygenase YgiN